MQIYGLDVGLRQEPHETNPTVKSNEVRVDLGVLVDFHLLEAQLAYSDPRERRTTLTILKLLISSRIC